MILVVPALLNYTGLEIEFRKHADLRDHKASRFIRARMCNFLYYEPPFQSIMAGPTSELATPPSRKGLFH